VGAAMNIYADSHEALIVGLARTGDRDAFAELVRRRQSWIRNLMRGMTGDVGLADDLAQQTFLQAWRKIRQLKQAHTFGPWLKRIAVTTCLQHFRKQDALRKAVSFEDVDGEETDSPGLGMDLDQALAELPVPVRLCIVLSYHEQLPHAEIAELTGIPLGTVKSHIRRGTERLKQLLAAYRETPREEVST
jgi:RNA polymerase sigma-70 factor (ECF subfamily)